MRKIILLALLVLLAGCKGEYRETAFMKLSNPPVPTGEWIAKHASYDYLALSYSVWDNPNMKVAQKQLLKANPNLKLGTYYSVHSLGKWMQKAPVISRAGQLWSRLSPYLCISASGDTSTIFKGSYVWNVLDPRARATAIEELVFYIRDNDLDWVMLDFFSVPLPKLRGDSSVLDLDGNGISHWDDPAEQQAMRSAFDDYMRVLRSLVPSDFLIIPNGKLAMTDTTFSRLVDGCYVEGFPAWFYGPDPATGSWDTGNYVNAFSPAYGPQALPRLSSKTRWYTDDPVIMVEDRWNGGLNAYVSMAYDHIVEMRRPIEPAVDTPAPLDLSYLGEPRGPATFVNGMLVREFSKGKMTLNITPTRIIPTIERK